MSTFLITDEWLVKHRTDAGGYNKKQLSVLGIEWPPKLGWKNTLIGKHIDIKKVQEFESAAKKSAMPSIMSFMATKDIIKSGTAEEESESLEEFVPDYYVYTDGSCSDNGSINAKAGMGIYFGKEDSRNISQRVEGKQSNNTAELGAIIMVYKIIEADITAGKKVMIASDSTYAIKAATTYGESHAKTSWKKDIPNKEMVKQAYELYKNVPNVRFMHILGHTEKQDVHSLGNDGADKLANQAIGLEACPYANMVEKIYLNVPFAKKEEAKKMGARWDAERKKWYVHTNTKNKDMLMEMFKN